MPKPRVGHRRDQRCWLELPNERHGFAQTAVDALPGLRYRRVQDSVRGPLHRYTLTVPVEGYESRQVAITFQERHWWRDPVVTVDGPRESPHRYTDGAGRRTQLCLWHPDDPVSRVWQPNDGLLHLVGIIAVHLFKEAWWHHYGTWLGHEHSHGDVSHAA